MSNNINVVFDRTAKQDSPGAAFDNEWAKSTFIITDPEFNSGAHAAYEEFIRSNRYSTSAEHKFTCTSPGMSLGVNPKPQFTRYCDIRSKGRLQRPDITPGVTSHPTGLGMGSYYSEAIDDNEQRIYMRFGVPKYMPLPLWIAKSFDIDKAVLHGRGTITRVFFGAIGLVIKFFQIAAAPVLAIGMYALQLYTANSRFYSIKDTMHSYWATVENILNMLVARRTMLPYMFTDYTYKLKGTVGTPEPVSPSFVQSLSDMIPDIIHPETGRIRVFAIALRSQAAFNKIRREEQEANANKKPTDEFDYPDITTNLPLTSTANPSGGIAEYLFSKAYGLLMDGNKEEVSEGLDEAKPSDQSIMTYDPAFTDENGDPMDTSLDPNAPGKGIEGKIESNINKKAATFDKYKEYALAELSEGAAFAVFNVSATGSIGESFSSSFGSNPIESTFNSFSAKSRNISSLMSSVREIPIVGDAFGLAADAGAKILSDTTFGIANPLLALAYGVNVSMPKIWEASSADLPRASYKIKLFSPYGNPYAQLFNVYLPLSMLLAGSLPRSTGASTYTSPFFCQLFDRGRTSIQLGMISQLGITRGTTNLAFTRAGHTSGIDIDLQVTNLDEIVAVDVNSGGVLSNVMAQFDTNIMYDTPFMAYMNTLAAVDVYTQVYRTPMIRLKLAERAMNLKDAINFEPAAFASGTVNSIPFGPLLRDILANNTQALQSIGTY